MLHISTISNQSFSRNLKSVSTHRVQLATSPTQKPDLNAHPFFFLLPLLPLPTSGTFLHKADYNKTENLLEFSKRASFPTLTLFKLFDRFSSYEGNDYMKC